MTLAGNKDSYSLVTVDGSMAPARVAKLPKEVIVGNKKLHQIVRAVAAAGKGVAIFMAAGVLVRLWLMMFM